MGHILHSRSLIRYGRYSVDEAFPEGFINISFAAFCGSSSQRNAVAVTGIRRCVGRKGIVLIHNDPNLIANLAGLTGGERRLTDGRNSFRILLPNSTGSSNSYYDALYGLPATNVVDAIAPLPENSPAVADIQSLRNNLADYLQIIQIQFGQNRAPFGQYPFNLDLLLDLTQMPYSELEQRILNFLPPAVSAGLRQRLSMQGAQQQAYAAVKSYALQLNSSLWTYHGAADHKRVSIVSAVEEGQMICVFVPNSRKEILDYLSVELNSLINRNIPYLLVTSGIRISESDRFKKLFLNDHITLPYSTGIIASDLTSALGSVNNESYEADQAAFFSQTQEIFVFSCPSILSARPFSDAIGNYYRLIDETHSDRNRQPFHIFSSHGHGLTTREQQQAIVNPEELTLLGNGCLIYGSDHAVPILVDEFTY